MKIYEEKDVYKKIELAEKMDKHRSDLYVSEMKIIIEKNGIDNLFDIMGDCFHLGYYKGYNKCKNKKYK